MTFNVFYKACIPSIAWIWLSLSPIDTSRSASTPAKAGRAGTGGTRDPTATPSRTGRGPRSEDVREPSRERTLKASLTPRSGGDCGKNQSINWSIRKKIQISNTFLNSSQVRQELQKIWGTTGKVKLHHFLFLYYYCFPRLSMTTHHANLLNTSLILQVGRHRSRRRAGG